jgi:hypothetical protein
MISIQELSQIYTSKSTSDKNAIILKHYSPDCVFEDPAVIVHGQKGVLQTMKGLQLMQVDYKPIAISILGNEVIEQEIPNVNDGTIQIINTQTYLAGSKTIVMECTTLLHVKDGLIHKHQDQWKNTFGLDGTVYSRFARPVVGHVSRFISLFIK